MIGYTHDNDFSREKAMEVIDATRSMEGLRWDFARFYDMSVADYKDVNQQIRKIVAQKSGISEDMIKLQGEYFLEKRSAGKPIHMIHLDLKSKSGLEIVNFGFDWAELHCYKKDVINAKMGLMVPLNGKKSYRIFFDDVSSDRFDAHYGSDMAKYLEKCQAELVRVIKAK